MSEEPKDLKEKSLVEKFPSVDLAYPLAVASYDLAQKRLDVVEGRLQTLLAFVVPVTLAVMAAAVGKNVTLRSGWFAAAIVTCVAGLGFEYTRDSQRDSP